MWKIAVGFVLFSVVAVYFLMQAGDTLNLSGESGGHSTEVKEPVVVTPATPVPADPSAAPAAK